MRNGLRARTALFIAAAGALAACSPKAPQLSANGLPIIKAGQWERTETLSTSPAPVTTRACLGPELVLPGAFILDGCTPAASSAAPAPGDQGAPAGIQMHYVATAPGAIKPAPKGFVVDIACSKGGTSTSLHTTIAGDLDAAFTVDSTSSIGQAGQPPDVGTTHDAYKYLGPCPAGN